MGKLDEKIELYYTKAQEIENNVDKELLTNVTKGLGPSIYKKDSESVSCSDDSELGTVRNSFLKKKLQLTSSDDELNDAIKNVCEQMGKSNRNKYRAIFYYLLTKKFNKQNIYA